MRVELASPYDVTVTLRVLGVGLGRTGTSSLKLALERMLGGRCHQMSEVLADPERHLALWAPALRGEDGDWEKVFAGYVAQVDFPGAAFWPEISRAFPDALVVLSTRLGARARARPSSNSTTATGHHRSVMCGMSGSGLATGSTTPRR